MWSLWLIAIGCLVLVPFLLFVTGWPILISDTWRNYENCRDSSCSMYQLVVKINPGFPMTRSGNTPCVVIPACLSPLCQRGQDASRCIYALSGLSCWPHQDFRHSRKKHSCLFSLAQKVTFILYHSPLKVFFFVSWFSLAQFLNSSLLYLISVLAYFDGMSIILFQHFLRICF